MVTRAQLAKIQDRYRVEARDGCWSAPSSTAGLSRSRSGSLPSTSTWGRFRSSLSPFPQSSCSRRPGAEPRSGLAPPGETCAALTGDGQGHKLSLRMESVEKGQRPPPCALIGDERLHGPLAIGNFPRAGYAPRASLTLTGRAES